ncbi:hypothetical protein ABTM00_20045, partial [Acinetobacter baumannii]
GVPLPGAGAVAASPSLRAGLPGTSKIPDKAVTRRFPGLCHRSVAVDPSIGPKVPSSISARGVAMIKKLFTKYFLEVIPSIVATVV